MYTLKDDGIISEVECGNNFGYVLENGSHFVNIDYKVLQSQSGDIFVKCMKMLYNGKIELYYVTDDYRAMSSMLKDIESNRLEYDSLITIVVNLFSNVIAVRNNGFLDCQNIDVSWDKIFIDSKTLKVKLVYLPINVKSFDSYAAFENELRASVVKLVDKVIVTANNKTNEFVKDLGNGYMSLKDIVEKWGGRSVQADIPKEERKNTIKLIAVNAPQAFEIVIEQDRTLIGKSPVEADKVISFNNLISRKHCEIVRENEEYYIMDVGSKNGTYLGESKERLPEDKKFIIKRGDIVRLANIRFQIV